MPVRTPKTPEEKRATIDLIKWVSTRMGVPPEETREALDRARQDDWQAALDLLSTYYVMKGIKKPMSN